jgi:hypothetical protein
MFRLLVLLSVSVAASASVSAMVNMDTLGLAETEVWVSHADPMLVRLMEVAAATAKLPVAGMNVENVGSTDSEPFREKKIPAITIHSVTSETWPILHSPKIGSKLFTRMHTTAPIGWFSRIWPYSINASTDPRA